jgi:8-oxo-dGTP pyrophosphatase MutT (NUDIX family)
MTDYFLQDNTPLVPRDAAAAVICLDDGRYLLQLRDQKAGLFYPGHWGLFGGAIESHETPETALRRELAEELGLTECDPKPLTNFMFEMSAFGKISRYFFEIRLRHANLAQFVLGEGSGMEAFHVAEILTGPRVVPYDSFAIWLHVSQSRFA